MSLLSSHISARARLFEFIRQEDLAERRQISGRSYTTSQDVSADALAAFQRVALKSLHRSA
ncbi:hypothetical protein [uncultured Tateyamaria sp.]|uniref:hypothetical protein n=1 Tax=Tateyamaria sp. 1078 TaxID=3417464 RepID=UPI00263A254B|nr:hypothetical protein [uncultured Tateyamaria sp.]